MVVELTVRGPQWFFGVDSAFEFFALIALLLITFFSIKAYWFTKDKRYRTFAIAFAFMSLGMFSRALTDLVVYLQLKAISPQLLFAGYAGYMLLTLISLVALFGLTLKAKQKAPLVALMLITIVGILLSASYRLAFHALAFILLAFIAFHFIRNYVAKKSFTAMLVCGSFVLLPVAQAAFIYDILRQRFYVVGHLIHLVAFGALFIAVALVRVKRK